MNRPADGGAAHPLREYAPTHLGRPRSTRPSNRRRNVADAARARFRCVGCGMTISNTEVAVAVHLRLDRSTPSPVPGAAGYGWACTRCSSRPPTRTARTHLDHGYWRPHEEVDPASPCEGCGQPVRLRTHHRRTRVLCSNACRMRTNPARAARAGNLTVSDTECRQCGATMAGARSSRHYCSSACRQRAYRIRSAEQQATLPWPDYRSRSESGSAARVHDEQHAVRCHVPVTVRVTDVSAGEQHVDRPCLMTGRR